MPFEAHIIEAESGLPALLGQLQAAGYRLIGPTIDDEAIIYDELQNADNLPAGWTDEQDGGHYRLKRREDNACFGFAVGPHSFKQFLHVPQQDLWRVRKEGSRIHVEAVETETPKYAFIGIRSCEIAAIGIQDRVLAGGDYADPHYQGRREDNFFLAVNCMEAGGTCFCVSMQTGPRARDGFDLALTEMIERDRHVFLVEIGSEQGAEIMENVPRDPATDRDLKQAAEVVAATEAQMGREMPQADEVPGLLQRNLDHARWDDVAARCLSCGNCTLVCPTCFCTDTKEESSLDGQEAKRSRHWDSCFTVDFTHLAGGSIRSSTRSRYRQWMTHKLSTWVDQFGSSGCVGCGRCITWCPVGIDITEEVRAIRESENQ